MHPYVAALLRFGWQASHGTGGRLQRFTHDLGGMKGWLSKASVVLESKSDLARRHTTGNHLERTAQPPRVFQIDNRFSDDSMVLLTGILLRLASSTNSWIPLLSEITIGAQHSIVRPIMSIASLSASVGSRSQWFQMSIGIEY